MQNPRQTYNTVTLNPAPISYSGRVVSRVLYEDKIIHESSAHNAGLMPLFDLLGRAVIGDLSANPRPVPNMIQLYTLTDSNASSAAPDLTPSVIASTGWQAGWSSDYRQSFRAATVPLFYSTAPRLTNNPSVESPSSTVTFYFNIPNTLITQKEVYALALLSATNLDDQAANSWQNTFAYFLYQNADGTVWNPLEIDVGNTQERLVVEWQLVFENEKSLDKVGNTQ